jgi:3-hydroxyisobutyrate dehydrogenase-like beta-hydroxyacid dehydrogenase
MGGKMAQRLAHVGFPVLAYNRSSDKLQPLLQSLGADRGKQSSKCGLTHR